MAWQGLFIGLLPLRCNGGGLPKGGNRARLGWVRLGRARHGLARRGMERPGRARQGLFIGRPISTEAGRLLKGGLGKERQGMAWQGGARLGKARQFLSPYRAEAKNKEARHENNHDQNHRHKRNPHA